MMKNILLFVFSLVFTSVMCQTTAEISNEFVISIEDANQKIPQYVEIDIQELEFNSEEDLLSFCNKFSLNYLQLFPNWDQQVIRLKLSQSYLNSKNINLQGLNERLLLYAPRMAFIYQNL